MKLKENISTLCEVLRVHYSQYKSGDNGREVTPVPIPNTAVKLFRAKSTWGAGPWEDKSPLVKMKRLAAIAKRFSYAVRSRMSEAI